MIYGKKNAAFRTASDSHVLISSIECGVMKVVSMIGEKEIHFTMG